MTVDRIVHGFAGLSVLAGLAGAHFLHPGWSWLAVFVGASLAQNAVTGFCPLTSLLRLAGIGSEGAGRR
jgi:hypothetical protein